MTQTFILSILTQGIMVVLMVSAPMLITALIVGFTVALLQTVTSIQEQTLSFVPKAFAVFCVLILVTPWILNTSISYMTKLYSQIPAMVP